MATREHKVSYRNGPQIMVSGLKLASLGYARDARVTVTDPSGDLSHAPWSFVVANDEHATLVSKDPVAPNWIQPGVLIRIAIKGSDSRHVAEPDAKLGPRRVSPPRVSTATPVAVTPIVTANVLAEWRRQLVRLLNTIEGNRGRGSDEKVGTRIGRLTQEELIPREIAPFMRVVTEMRNQTEYHEKVLDAIESEAATAAWRAVAQWAKSQGFEQSRPP